MNSVQLSGEAAFFDRYYEEEYRLIADFLKDPTSQQSWPVVPAAMILKVWKANDKAQFGLVRHEKLIDKIADRLITNIIRLSVNTRLCGHSQFGAADIVADLFEDVEWTEELDEQFGDHCLDDRGQWRISDYASNKLCKDAVELLSEINYARKLEIIDRILQRVHQRGDLAKSFIEGGSHTLSLR